ncbi:deoxyribonuclease IV [Paenibacillus sediminis]|uniref:Deoxyribonuclease-4 n=1 Tax=Paenibacillus sediminis TaxID=664909 RepID=A0ABS4H0V5_9BACL|nr:deoxyribonuclease IV [Paenibacillus sediminis]MBP1935902.1 deoxyribonuclease-4 [Paenibacillus sediminis]
MTTNFKIGSHISIRGGYKKAAQTAWEIGANAFQYFPKNPRSLSVKTIDYRDAEGCLRFCREKGIVSIAHTPYPSNLAVSRKHSDLFGRIVASLRNDLQIAEACGSLGIVVHFGRYKEAYGDPLDGYKNIIECINEVLANWEGSAKLLIENQAGDHGGMGTTLEELVQIRKLSASPEKIGFCLDTCHAFAAGMWAENAWDAFLDKGKNLGYFDHLIAIHLNDSKYPYRSRKDRHARVGTGYIGERGFKEMLRYPELSYIPLILESEEGQDGTHREDISRVRSWVIEAESH